MLHCPSDCFAFRFGKAVPLDINFAVFIVWSTHILSGLIFIRPLPVLVFCTTERYSHAEFIIIYSGAWMGCRIEATPLTITDILLNDYCITCNMYVHNYSPLPPLSLSHSLTCASNYKIHFNWQKVLRSSFAKLVIFLKEIAYVAFDLPGALYFSI